MSLHPCWKDEYTCNENNIESVQSGFVLSRSRQLIRQWKNRKPNETSKKAKMSSSSSYLKVGSVRDLKRFQNVSLQNINLKTCFIDVYSNFVFEYSLSEDTANWNQWCQRWI